MVNSVRLYYMYYKFAKYIHMSYVSREIHTKQCCCAVCTNVGCHWHTACQSLLLMLMQCR